MEFDNPAISKDDHRQDDSDYENTISNTIISSPVSGEAFETKRQKKDKKKQKDKETRYATLGDCISSNEEETEKTSPVKTKKSKAFLFGSAKKDKERKKEGSSFDSTGKKKEKQKIKIKKSKQIEESETNEKNDESPIFGVPLELAVKRNKCYDGIQLPVLVRQCISHIENEGLLTEGIYRSSGVKSKVNKLKNAYNSRQVVDLCSYDLPVIASVLKLFLRELPYSVLTEALAPKFEAVSVSNDPQKKIESMKSLLNQLPECNRLLIQWIFVHMGHVIQRERFNKMTLQNVSIVLNPTMRISHRVLHCFFENSHILFDGVVLRKYVPPLTAETTKYPEHPEAIEEEIRKQESLLADLHLQISSGVSSKKTEEQIWEHQRIVTQLKRQLRTAKKSENERDSNSKPKYEPIDYDEELDFSLQTLKTETMTANTKIDEKEERNGGEKEIIASKDETKLQNSTPNSKGSHEQSSFVESSSISYPKESFSIETITEEERDRDVDENSFCKTTSTEVKCSFDTHSLFKEKREEMLENHVTVISCNANDVSTYANNHKVSFKLPANPSTIPLLPPPPCKTRDRINLLSSTSTLLPPSSLGVKSKSLPRGYQANFEQKTQISSSSNSSSEDEKEEIEALLLELEYDELMALKSELETRKRSERKEIEELKEELASMQTLYQYRTYSVDSSENSSDEGSEDDVEELSRVLSHLIRENRDLEDTRNELQRKIQDERSMCIKLRVQIRLEQERMKKKVRTGNLL